MYVQLLVQHLVLVATVQVFFKFSLVVVTLIARTKFFKPFRQKFY